MTKYLKNSRHIRREEAEPQAVQEEFQEFIEEVTEPGDLIRK